MASTLSASPRKVVPLAAGDYSRPRKDSASCPTITKRAFYCGVVVEGSENGRRLPDDVQDLVLSLGNALSSSSSNDMLSSPDLSEDITDPSTHRTRDTDPSTLQSVITELLTSERSYVKRLQILKNDYADPLRNFAKSKDTTIIPAYEAKTLFGNIDNLLPVNEAFLADLEKMMAPNGVQLVGGVGDVALKHFKELRGFEQYKQYYVKREEAQLIFEREISKRSARFVSFIDRIKYQSSDPRNRIGLRELLMEPVQRIPRYTLLFRNMIKNLVPDDPQRAKLLEADDIASKIALAEADEQTKRAAIFYCLTASIEGFPPDLFSNSRQYIDCIDVIDVPVDVTSSSASSTSGASPNGLPCSLFLFDDKLVIVKRPGNGEKGARTLSGLDELDKFTKASGLSISKKKSGMTCKGVVDVTEVVATDVGGCDLHLYLETPPQDQSDRWSGRPFRSLSVVLPPLAPNLDPIQAEATKSRFLENFWHTQAMYRARAGQSVVLRAEEQEVESKAGKVTFARAYYNVYQRTAFLQEPKKTKIVVHVDQLGTADPIPFGDGGPPFARIRLQPMAGGLCRYSVNSSIADEGEEDIVQTDRVPGRVIQTIHQFGLFEFKTGKTSAPSTPTARSRVAIFGLDAISRNLFNTRPGSSMGDFFGGSVNGHRRTKSTISRSSIYTQSTSTGDSLMKFSHRSNSTAATTISTMDDDSSFFASKSSRSRKLLKRGKSPGGSTSDSEKTSPARRQTRSFEISRSPSPAVERDTYYSDIEDDGTIMAKGRVLDSSEWDLAVQLELARRNSQNQSGLRIPPSIEAPTQDTIYEEGQPPPTARPLSCASRESNIPRPVSPNAARSTSPSSRHSKSSSLHAQDRRPIGPRSPSPLPSTRATPSSQPPEDTRADDNASLVSPLTQVTPPGLGSQPSGIPRSKRQPFFPAGNTDTTPKASVLPSTTSTTVEPLSIKKKSLVHPNGSTPTSARKPYVRNSPLTRHPSRTVSRKVSPQLGKRKAAATAGTSQLAVTAERISQLSAQTLEDIESSRRAIKRVKLLADDSNFSQLTPGKDDDNIPRPSSPDKLSLRPVPALTKAAQDRMEEMRQMISRRQAEGTPRRIRNTLFDTALKSPASSNSSEVSRLIESLAKDAEKDLTSAVSKQEELQKEVQQLLTGLNARFTELEKTRIELQNVKRQCEVVKSLLADATAEKEIMYEAFNEELDCMYNDVNLPDDEAWVAMTQDLRMAKESRNALSKENSQLKRRIAELESQQEEWGNLLRAHGLLS